MKTHQSPHPLSALTKVIDYHQREREINYHEVITPILRYCAECAARIEPSETMVVADDLTERTSYGSFCSIVCADRYVNDL